MKNLTIYCCYHEDDQLLDDGNVWFNGKTGLLNPFINEMSMFYWIWKNDKTSDYIGTCHYRRRLLKDDINLDHVTDKSAVGFELHHVHDSREAGLRDFAEAMQCSYLYDDFLEYAKSRYGADNIYLDQERRMRLCGKWTILRNTFVLTRDLFMGLCDFVFGFVDFHDRKHGLGYIEERYHAQALEWLHSLNGRVMYDIKLKDYTRILGYFLEKLTDVYLQAYITEYHAI